MRLKFIKELFENKQKKVENLIKEYCGYVVECTDSYEKIIKEHCKEADHEKLRQNYRHIHRIESKADDTRRDIEILMYTKALFPESRGDILGLLETLDRIPNAAESAIRSMLNEYITIPSFLAPSVIQLAGVCNRCVKKLIEGVNSLFIDFTNATIAVGNVDELESEADFIESTLIEHVFASDLNGVEKILLRDLVKKIAEVSDRAENVADRIRIIVAKRKV